MKNAGTLAAHLSQEVTTVAYCWRVVRVDNGEYGFTSHDVDLVVNGLTYQASTGFTASAVETSASLNVDDLSIDGILSSPSITEEELLAGKWDHARVELFLVNYADTTQGPLKLRVGWLGEVSVRKGQFTAELRGLTQRLQQTIGRTVQAACDADLGDARCGVDVPAITLSGAVTDFTSRRIFGGDAVPATAWGLIVWTTGLNEGRRMEVKSVSTQTIELAQPMPYDIQVGDQYTIYPGCDKSFATCRDNFSNSANFRGFPYVSTVDRIVRGPTT